MDMEYSISSVNLVGSVDKILLSAFLSLSAVKGVRITVLRAPPAALKVRIILEVPEFSAYKPLFSNIALSLLATTAASLVSSCLIVIPLSCRGVITLIPLDGSSSTLISSLDMEYSISSAALHALVIASLILSGISYAEHFEI